MIERPPVRRVAVATILSCACAACGSSVTQGIGGGIALVGAGTACVGTAMVTQGALCGGEDDEDDTTTERTSLYDGADPEAGAVVFGVGAGLAVLGGIIYAIGVSDAPSGIAKHQASTQVARTAPPPRLAF